jgi:5-hydroxyisourate hydrolase
MGRLTTHVLDTAQGCPAAGMTVALYRRESTELVLLTTITTNEDGRAPAPLLHGDDLVVGHYALVFSVGVYFTAAQASNPGLVLAQPGFLDEVPVYFAIANPDGHYHVPLLVSPWGYTTYRGS